MTYFPLLRVNPNSSSVGKMKNSGYYFLNQIFLRKKKHEGSMNYDIVLA